MPADGSEDGLRQQPASGRSGQGVADGRETTEPDRQAASLLPKKRFMERDSQPPALRSLARLCICARTAPT
ncbi:hypothetical protein GCM10027398_24280 [Azotobacter salinestris]